MGGFLTLRSVLKAIWIKYWVFKNKIIVLNYISNQYLTLVQALFKCLLLFFIVNSKLSKSNIHELLVRINLINSWLLLK